MGAKLPPTRNCCDELYFQDSDEAAAYTVQHLTDRYGRVTQVLERLFAAGHLPLRRRQMSVLEVGAGPAPGLYAARDFYADLALWAETSGHEVPFLPVMRMHALDKGEAWGRLLHSLSEHLIALRSDLPSSPGAFPFRVEYSNLAGFSVIREHVRALDHAAESISAEFDQSDEPITRATARRFAEEDGVGRPSAYDLVVTSNFLTAEGSVKEFQMELRQLASGLTPGGLLIVIGAAAGNKYARIWSALRTLMRCTELTEIKGFEEPIAANLNPEWAKAIRRQRQDILDELRGVDALPNEVAGLQATDGFPTFRVLVWKNQRPARKGPRRRASATG
ncbi:hypothetical protein [Streptomyces sp. BA2]|uniref:hypothetical protein n=1 Tax=Streptomyces sp. BA2 TaxID=436595 RepID=UPI0013224A43|nr:hypothetical protein [Streptomyces sp. BA2]MWA08634.1 hypothetical protein [Streptomyces sp. BA2]